MSGDAITHIVSHLANNERIGVLTGEGNRILHASDGAKSLLGLEGLELASVNWVMMTPPEYRLVDDAAIRQAIATGASQWVTKEYVRGDGSRVRADVLAITVKPDPFQWIALVRPAVDEIEASGFADAAKATALVSMARRFAGVAGLAEVFDIVDRMAAATLGAAYINVALSDPASERLLLHHDPGLEADVQLRWTDVPVNAETLLGDSAARQEILVCWDLDELRSRYPAQGEDAARLGFETLAAVPLRSDHGVMVGVMGVAWTAASQVDLDQASLVADLVANAVELGQTLDRHRSIEQTFQEMLLPAPEAVSKRIEVAVRYRGYDGSPAGDFYDVIDTDDGVWLVVGDVVGHGIGAARTMGKIRFFVRALCGSIDPHPGELLDRISALLLRERQDEVATCVAVRWALGSPTIQIASAGHPPPVVITDGDCGLLDVEPGVPLGVGLSVTPTPVRQVPCPDRLVLYSDGLIERRRDDMDTSFGRLLAAVQRNRLVSLDALADALLGTLATGSDDVVVACADFASAG